MELPVNGYAEWQQFLAQPEEHKRAWMKRQTQLIMNNLDGNPIPPGFPLPVVCIQCKRRLSCSCANADDPGPPRRRSRSPKPYPAPPEMEEIRRLRLTAIQDEKIEKAKVSSKPKTQQPAAAAAAAAHTAAASAATATTPQAGQQKLGSSQCSPG